MGGPWRSFMGCLNNELVEWRPSSGNDVEPSTASGATKLYIAQLDSFGIKPLGATLRASYRSPLTVWNAMFLTAAGAGYDCQVLLHRRSH
jgi:hypothetical protein